MIPSPHNSMVRPAPQRGAFTLIEMIVVMVVLTVLAGVTTVRMGNTLPRRGKVVVQRVQNVLDTLAHRQVASQAPEALVYDAGIGELWVERFDFAGRMGERPTTRSLEGQWRRDVLAPPVRFDKDIRLSAAMFDGQVERGSFRLEVTPDTLRPTIEIDIAYGTAVDTVSLLPSEMRSINLAEGSSKVRLSPEDLNAIGAGDERW